VTDLTPTELLTAVREVVHPDRVRDGAVVLEEDGRGNKCPPIRVSYHGEHWALRVQHNDHLKLLAGASESPDRSFCKLPDYLIFAEPRRSRKRRKGGSDADLLVVVCELKSSEGGVAAGARRQVQLGKFLAQYLLKLGLFARTRPDHEPTLDIVGVVLSPYPAKQTTLTREPDEGRALDTPGGMWVYPRPSDDDLRIEELFR
jgi:hypothetical protein